MGTRKRWKYSAGRRPNTVTVEEFEVGGNIYVRLWIAAEQKHRYRSLRHRDRKRAMEYADQLAGRLAEGRRELLQERVTVERLFRLYQHHRTPAKAPDTQLEDERRAELFTRVLGPARKVDTLGLADWDAFIRARGTGAIDPRGKPVSKDKRSGVRPRTVQADLAWLRATLNWATKWRRPDGTFLLVQDPLRGLPFPSDRNPRRPIATQDRFEKVRGVSDRVMMRSSGSRAGEVQRSFLSELLDLANGTGRRISAILKLRYRDLCLDVGPHGSIRWPAETDKVGRESLVPLGPDARSAIDRVLRERPGIGAAYLFPRTDDPTRPVRYELASAWLIEAERLAEVPKQNGSLWHAYRRKWATERKHLPDVDVAAAGGWTNPRTLVEVYQQPDQDSMLRVVLEAGRLQRVAD